MRQNNSSSQPIVLDNCTFQTAGKVKSDLLVLRYMTQKIHLHLLNLPPTTLLPSVDYVQERHNHIHRIVVYNQQEILLKSNLVFVGFISGIQEHVGLATIQELHRVDKLLIAELAGHPGLFSYSSLELHKNHWYNLVLLSDHTAKTYFKHNSTHRYASYQLAAHYYAWIRLHNGVMPGGLPYNEMLLQSTKYYTFPGIGQKPTRREVPYDITAQQGVPGDVVPWPEREVSSLPFSSSAVAGGTGKVPEELPYDSVESSFF